ncbi:MAG: PTS sugar transporter subunit IIA [Burkholderiaceae bacterium]|nr:PTS sugar transporter subunit IIA [Burkholderiaceae bacterium]
MSQIVLVMHEPLGSAFKRCAQHVLGDLPDLMVFDIPADANPEVTAAAIRDSLLHSPDHSALVLCDIYGATPFNIAQSAVRQVNSAGGDAHLLTGANLCMVLKAVVGSREQADTLSEVVRLRALTGIVDAGCQGD